MLLSLEAKHILALQMLLAFKVWYSMFTVLLLAVCTQQSKPLQTCCAARLDSQCSSILHTYFPAAQDHSETKMDLECVCECLFFFFLSCLIVF